MQCPQQRTRDQRRVIDSVFPAQADNTIHLMRAPDTTQNTGMVRVSADVYAFNTHKTNSILAQAVCSSVTDVLEEFMDVKEKEVCRVKTQRAQYSLVGTNLFCYAQQMDKKALQTERMVKVKERMQNNATM